MPTPGIEHVSKMAECIGILKYFFLKFTVSNRYIGAYGSNRCSQSNENSIALAQHTEMTSGVPQPHSGWLERPGERPIHEDPSPPVRDVTRACVCVVSSGSRAACNRVSILSKSSMSLLLRSALYSKDMTVWMAVISERVHCDVIANLH